MSDQEVDISPIRRAGIDFMGYQDRKRDMWEGLRRQILSGAPSDGLYGHFLGGMSSRLPQLEAPQVDPARENLAAISRLLGPIHAET